MKDKITKLRNELKQLNKPKIYVEKKPIDIIKLPYIKKNKIIVEDYNNDILNKL